jgi:hypothetical protein
VIGNVHHAARWVGTAASFTDLNPSGATDSEALATTNSQQAGFATIGGTRYAAIWSGSYDSFVNLHPAAASASEIRATIGTRQAGIARIGGNDHAGIWAGTAGSFFDLHALLGPGYGSSSANGLSVTGSIITVAGSAHNTGTAREEAVLWRYTPAAHAPTVRVAGGKTRVVKAATLNIRGTAADLDGDLSRVEVKVGAGKYNRARGLARWSFTARGLPRGRSNVLVRAADSGRKFSPVARLTIFRK